MAAEEFRREVIARLAAVELALVERGLITEEELSRAQARARAEVDQIATAAQVASGEREVSE